MRRFLPLSSVLCFLLISTGCKPINALKAKLFATEEEEIVKPNKRKPKAEAPSEAPANNVPQPPADLSVQTPPANAAAPEVAAEPSPAAPVSPEQAPAPSPVAATAPANSTATITSKNHFAGTPTAMGYGADSLFVVSGKNLTWYDADLKPVGTALLEEAASEVTARSDNGIKTLYAESPQNLLQIIPMAGGAMQTKRMQGPFDIFSLAGAFAPSAPETSAGAAKDALLVVYLADRVQIQNLNNPADIKMAAEIPVSNVTSAYPAGSLIYLARENSLETADRFTSEIRSSIPIGTRFKILRVHEENGLKFLVLALKNAKTGKWGGFQFLELSNDFKLKSLGSGIDLKEGADQLAIDPTDPVVYLSVNGKPVLFDLVKRRETTAIKDFPGDIQFIAGGHDSIYLGSKNSVTQYNYQLAAANPPDPAASFSITGEKTLLLPSAPEAVLLLNANATLLINGQTPTPSAPLFLAQHSAGNDSGFAPLNLAALANASINRIVATANAFFAIDEKNRKIYAIKKDFSGAVALDMPAQTIRGVDALSDAGGHLLYVNGGESDGVSNLARYRVSPDWKVKKESQIPLPAGSGGVKAYANGKSALAACGAEGACWLDLETEKPNIKLAGKVATTSPQAQALEVLISPSESVAYVFNESSSGSFISILDLKAVPPKEIGKIPSVTARREQFRNASFSSGGQRLLLPQDDGLTVLDVKNPRNPSISLKWPVGRVRAVDVTNQGKKICVALGEDGVECGEMP